VDNDMKTAEDEAFDELATRQGDWGSGFQVKKAMAEDKLQEPVARVTGVYGGRFTYDPLNRAMVLPIGMALYAWPQRPWVGLTDEEIDKTYWRREPFRRPTQFEFARDIEQLIKEKNT
jgi:hypothetical protein